MYTDKNENVRGLQGEKLSLDASQPTQQKPKLENLDRTQETHHIWRNDKLQ